MSTPPHYNVIIVGTGLAGYTLARELRKQSKTTTLLLVTQDDGAYYSKPMLSNGLAKNKTATDLATKSAAQMSDTLDATVMANTTVSDIDAVGKRIVTDQGAIGYDSLVLACGAQQIHLPIEGAGAADVLTVNDLADYAEFRDRLAGVERVAVMGPGLIGCEFANDLANIDKVTIIIGPDIRPLERLIPPLASAALKKAMDALGVEWHLETVVQRIEKIAGGYELHLSSGDKVKAGLVLSAAGLKPDLTLAMSAGLETSIGIVVDRYLRSSDENIYALGDCIEIHQMVLPYVMPIMHASKALAKTLTGDPVQLVYPAMPVAIKTPVHPVVVAPPPANTAGSWLSEETVDGVRALFQSEDGSLLGFVLTGGCVKEKVKLERELPKLLA